MSYFYKISILIFSLALIFSCKSDKSTMTKATERAKTQTTEAVSAAADDLSQFGIAANDDNALGGLQIGDHAPDFSLVDHNGQKVVLSDLTHKGPVVLTFYRAHWCGYCTRQLAELQTGLATLKSQGVTVLAVSPEQSSFASEMAKEKGITYPILYDEDHEVAKKYKGLFHVTDIYQERVSASTEKSIAEINGDLEAKMPVPATYVIGTDNIIKYAFYNPDYSKRAKLETIFSSMDI